MVVEYLTKGYYPSGQPNPADSMQPMASLIKAIIINSGKRITGLQANIQGTGFPNFDQVFCILASLERL